MTKYLLTSIAPDAYLLPLLVLFSIVLIGVTVYMATKARDAMAQAHLAQRATNVNFSLVLLIMLAVAVGLFYLLKIGLEAQWGMLNTMLFSALPYLAMGIFLLGSIYRYINRGFQVSSLSSEFLERRKLFWGSQPFHYGLLFLFFGHLMAFLFPRSILAWNGEPVRLLILEYTSFAFGLAVLFGLVLLIKRRLGNKRVLVVTNKMDMLVYAILITQVLSGLGVALFVRWGSSWFASSLAPYMRSIFTFQPDIAAVSAMPWLIQIHVVSAFVLIGIIPFTRFIHFLVAPIDYLWRSYQLVMWNWSRRGIRRSTSYYPGVKSKNN